MNLEKAEKHFIEQVSNDSRFTDDEADQLDEMFSSLIRATGRRRTAYKVVIEDYMPSDLADITREIIQDMENGKLR